MEAFCGKEFAPGPRALAQGIAVAMSKPKTAGNGTNSCRPSGLPKPALHFVEALRHSYGYAARASSRGMTGLGKQNGFHLSLDGSRMVRAGLEARRIREGACLTCRGCGDGFVTRKGFTPVAPGGIRGQALLSGPMK